jgi:hypothetical protein
LAGRAALLDLCGLNLSEAGAENHRMLWWRGGFPPAYLAQTDRDWEEWQTDFTRLVLERDLPQLGVNIPSATLLRFWRMVAHCHGAVWNSSEPARSMGVAELDLMVLWKGRRIGFEFKFADAPGITKSMHVAMADLKLDRLLVLVTGKESYDLGPKMEAVSILHLVERLGRMAED